MYSVYNYTLYIYLFTIMYIPLLNIFLYFIDCTLSNFVQVHIELSEKNDFYNWIMLGGINYFTKRTAENFVPSGYSVPEACNLS